MPHVPGHGQWNAPGGPNVEQAIQGHTSAQGQAQLYLPPNYGQTGHGPYGPVRPANLDLELGGAQSAGLRDLFGRLNVISMRNEAGGGRGGGSQQFEGNMDANTLIALNEYMGENVTSFNKGGALRSIYDQGGEVNYSVDLYNPPKFSTGYDGGAEQRRINEIRGREWMEHVGLNPYTQVQRARPGSLGTENPNTDDLGEMVAIGKLSTPVKKNFASEATIKVKLTY